MKLGTQTASLVNHLQSRAVIGQPEPAVGMGVTFLHWTDRSAGTIFRVFSVGKSVCIETRDDECRRTDGNGLSESQSWEFKTNVRGSKRYFRRENDGRWSEIRFDSETKRWKKTGGCGLHIGARDAYNDPSF
jgi:hypothetical protein